MKARLIRRMRAKTIIANCRILLINAHGGRRESRRRSYAPSWRLNRAAKGMRYQLPALGGQLARKLPKFFIRGGLQKHFDAVERRAVEFIGHAGQHEQPVKCELPSRLRQGANLL